MGDSSKRVTIRNVAEKAGVSAMAVSIALNNKPGVSDSTRAHIIKIAKELNYFPNQLATNFRTNKTNTMGIVMSKTFLQIFTRLFEGIEAEATKSGYSIITVRTEDAPKKEHEVIELMISKGIDGLILTSPLFFNDEEASWVKKQKIPFVIAMRSHPDKEITTIRNNNFLGAKAMADHLAQTGSKNILILSLEHIIDSTKERLGGWLTTLEGYGIAVPPQQISYTYAFVENGYSAMKERLKEDIWWDTVICGCDLIAVGAIEALLEAGIKVPEQVRVCGYDDIPMAQYLRVPLTTIRQPLYEIGKQSVQMLDKLIHDPSAPARQVILDSNLVVRKST